MAVIPKGKRFFRIGEASKIIGVEPYVLRYWEKEFPQLKPKRADSKHRTYEQKDIELLLQIKKLLYEERMTIQGARKKLREREKSKKRKEIIREVKKELHKILELLS
jgi:DNA-binding transcriptional MerR regulator